MTDEEYQVAKEKEYVDLWQSLAPLEEAIDRLTSSKDFKIIIDEWFYKRLANEAIKHVSNITLSLENREKYMEQLKAIGYFKNFLDSLKLQAQTAKTSLKNLVANKQ